MGMAEIVPGVSGSTLAIAMGIYQKLIDTLYNLTEIVKFIGYWLIGKASWQDVKLAFREIDWKFTLLLGAGVLTSVILLANILSQLIDSYPAFMLALFFGITIASAYTPWSETKQGVKEFAIAVIAACCTFVLFGLPISTNLTITLPLLFIAGLLGVTGMILPGVSGGFILLLLGIYDQLIGWVKNLTRLNFVKDEILSLFVFGLGFLVGFFVVLRSLKYALSKNPNAVLAAISGAMLGSVRILWPYVQLQNGIEMDKLPKILPWQMPSGESIAVTVFILIGIGVVLAVSWLARGTGKVKV